MKLYLLTGTPGQAKSEIAKKIAAFLTNKNITVGVGDVEKELIKLFRDTVGQPAVQRRHPLVNLIGKNPPDEIKDKWPEAYRNAVKEAKSTNPQVAIVVARLEYYRFETYEFYSPVDLEEMRKEPPENILTLIDDIYDVYYRLSRAGQVFDIRRLRDLAFPPSESTSRDSKNLRKLYKDSFNLVLGSLLRILVWREKEISAGANLAGALGCRHQILAIKHPVETGVRLLLGDSSKGLGGLGKSYPVYISHPISRARREKSWQDTWPTFVEDLDEVVTALRNANGGDSHVVPIMPTAIDEFRLLDDGTYLQPHLTRRWKLGEGEYLYCRPEAPEGMKGFDNHQDYETRGLSKIFDPPIDSSGRCVGLPLPDAELSGMLRLLRESIRLQLSGRDHLLVRQCPGLFLYRPLYAKHEFSSGVSAEMITFRKTRGYETSGNGTTTRRIALIHDCTDVEGFFGKKENGDFRDTVTAASHAIVELVTKLTREAHAVEPALEPQPNDVAAALKIHGDPLTEIQKLYDKMSGTGSSGTLGVSEPVEWDRISNDLTNTIMAKKLTALAGDVDERLLYKYYQGNNLVFEHRNSSQGTADSYVEIVENINRAEIRKQPAERVKRFFAGANVEESQEESV